MEIRTALYSRTRRMLTRSFGAVALAAVASTPAFAQNLVTNGNFETGFLSGYTTNNPCSGLGVFRSGIYNNTPGGTYSVGFNGRTADCAATLSQTLNTVAGQTYNISFFATSPQSAAGNNLKFMFGGATVFNQTINNSDFQQFFATGIATSNSTDLTVSGFTSRGTFVDDISVTAAGVTTTPEPSSMALLGTGLVGLVPMIRRRRRA